jgi:hypothetical protein
MMDDVDPIAVHIVKDDTKGHNPPPRGGVHIRNTTAVTYQSVLNGGVGILGVAARRSVAVISVLGVVGTNSNVTLTTSSGEGNMANGEGTGAMLQPGMTVRHYGTDALFLSAIGAGTPPLVSVIQVFDQASE